MISGYSIFKRGKKGLAFSRYFMRFFKFIQVTDISFKYFEIKRWRKYFDEGNVTKWIDILNNHKNYIRIICVKWLIFLGSHNMMECVVQMQAGINKPKINVEYIMDCRHLGIWAFGRKGNIWEGTTKRKK